MSKISSTFAKRGFDSGVIFYFLSKGWLGISVPLTMFLVTTLLSQSEQGYYYTMLSLIQFQVLAEFGFNTVLIQFISHEWASLRIENGEVVGDEVAKARLASLVRIACGWAVVVVLLTLLLVGAGGYIFIATSHPSDGITWQLAWILLSLAVSLSMVGTVLRSITEGCHQVAESQKASLFAYICGNISAWVALYLGYGLYALFALQALQGLINIALLGRKMMPVLRLLRVPSGPHKVAWKQDFLRQQSKIGLSWLAGLFMYQAFVPIIFAVSGPEEAGRFGILMQAYQFANVLAMAWIINAQPKMGGAWAKRDMNGLHTLVRTTIRRSLLTAAFAVACAVGLIFVLKQWFPYYGERFSDLETVVIMLSVAVIQQRMNVETAAVRFSKSEPYIIPSIVSAVLIICFTYVSAHFGTIEISIAYFVIIGIFTNMWCHRVYQRYVDRFTTSEVTGP